MSTMSAACAAFPITVLELVPSELLAVIGGFESYFRWAGQGVGIRSIPPGRYNRDRLGELLSQCEAELADLASPLQAMLIQSEEELAAQAAELTRKREVIAGTIGLIKQLLEMKQCHDCFRYRPPTALAEVGGELHCNDYWVEYMERDHSDPQDYLHGGHYVGGCAQAAQIKELSEQWQQSYRCPVCGRVGSAVHLPDYQPVEIAPGVARMPRTRELLIGETPPNDHSYPPLVVQRLVSAVCECGVRCHRVPTSDPLPFV